MKYQQHLVELQLQRLFFLIYTIPNIIATATISSKIPKGIPTPSPIANESEDPISQHPLVLPQHLKPFGQQVSWLSFASGQHISLSIVLQQVEPEEVVHNSVAFLLRHPNFEPQHLSSSLQQTPLPPTP